MGTISMPSPMGPEGPAGPKLHTQQVWQSRFESKQSDFRTTCLTALQRCIPAQQYSRAQSQQQRTVQNAQHSGAFTASKKRLLTFLSLWQSNNFNLVYLIFFFFNTIVILTGFPHGSAGKESACNLGDLGSIPGLGRSPGEGKGYPLQYSGLENSMDCIVLGVAKSQTPMSNFHFHIELWCRGQETLPGIVLLPIWPPQSHPTCMTCRAGLLQPVSACALSSTAAGR